MIPLLPEDIHHFAEGKDSTKLCLKTVQKLAYVLSKEVDIRLSIHHEAVQNFTSIAEDDLLPGEWLRNIDFGLLKKLHASLQMG